LKACKELGTIPYPNKIFRMDALRYLKAGAPMLSGSDQAIQNAEENEVFPQFKLSLALQATSIPDWEKTYQVITTLPLPEKLDLERVPTGLSIKKTYSEIYYYLVSREFVENQKTFFHHIVGTVLYEAMTKEPIYGKSHDQKAFATFKLVQKTIAEIDKTLLKRAIFPVHIPVLNEHKANLKFHYNALLAALKSLPEEMKERILRKQKFNIDEHSYLSISEVETELATLVHPQTLPTAQLTTSVDPKTPSPKKKIEKTTPKSLNSPCRKSMIRLRKKLFSEISDEAPASTIQPSDFDSSLPQREFLVQFNQIDLKSYNENASQNIQPTSTSSPLFFEPHVKPSL